MPEEIKKDYEGRKEDETVFVFPFNDKKIKNNGEYEFLSKDLAYQDISSKLQSLLYPSMFLNNIKNIEYTIENNNLKQEGEYKKEIIKSRNIDEDITAEFIKYTQPKAGKPTEEIFWKFNRKIEINGISNLTCSVVFLVDEKNKNL